MWRSALRRLAACVATCIATSAAAHLPGAGESSVMEIRDKVSGAQGYSFDVNAAVAFFNGGWSVRHWDRDVIGWNGRLRNNEATVYVGVGLINLVQVQRGFSTAGVHTRIRFDIGLSENFPFTSDEKWGSYRKGIVLTPFVERRAGRKLYGLGIGLQFH